MVTSSKRRNGQNAARNAKKSACSLRETASVAKKPGSTAGAAASLSPALAACISLERPAQLRRDPAAVEAARLGRDAHAADTAVKVMRVERDVIFQLLGACKRMRVTPADAWQFALVMLQGPVAGRSLPFAK